MFEGAWIIILLSVMNIMVMIYCIHLFRYHVKALKFLRNAVNVITENGELDELEDLTELFIPTYIKTKYATKGMLYFAYVTLMLNVTFFLMATLPSEQSTIIWSILIYPVVGSNAFIIVAFNSFIELKVNVNATCESYDVLIQSYKHVKEYEDNNNDSSN